MNIQLTRSLTSWGKPGFDVTLKQEIESLDQQHLPLYKALSVGNHVLDDSVNAMVIKVTDSPQQIHAKVGVFYSSLLTGCACANDPTPENENSEYCVLMFDIDKQTGVADVRLVEE